MLLQEIVEAFDAELDKLYRLRTIIADLAGNAEVEVVSPDATDSVELHVASGSQEITAVPKRRTRGPQLASAMRVRRKPANEQRAAEPMPLSGSIPKGPVVVMPAALARELAAKSTQRAVKTEAEIAPEPGSLASMIRKLHLERMA